MNYIDSAEDINQFYIIIKVFCKMKKNKDYAVSGELNESVTSVEGKENESLVGPSGVDTFLDKE